MTSKLSIASIVICWLAIAGRASAELRNFELQAPDGKRCVARQTDVNAEPKRLVVVLLVPAGVAATEWALSYTNPEGGQATQPFSGTPLQAALDLSAIKADAGITPKGKVAGAPVDCGEFRASASAGEAQPGTAGRAGPADTSRDQAARVWFASPAGRDAAETLKKDVVQRLQLKRVELLPHLPSGAAASPYPASVAENVDLQIAVIIDKNEAKLRVPRLTAIVCPDREGLRILGDLKDLIGKGQGGAPSLKADFVLLPIEKVLQCGAGDVKYTFQMYVDAKPNGDPVESQVKLRPIYQLAATGSWGFDTANLPAYAAVDGKVAETRSRQGTQLYVGFIWYPTGIDYDHVTWTNRVAPFFFFDPAAIKDHLIAGAALTVKGRISIPVGLSAHRVPVLAGLSVDSPFVGDGAIPTKPDWRRKGLGLFVGVAFNVAEFARVKNAVTPAAK